MRTWSKYQLAVFENVANGTGHTMHQCGRRAAARPRFW